jgi:ribokinase
MPRHVIIDTDPGVDDALALILALQSPEICVDAITTVSGNVHVDLATHNALTVLGLFPPQRRPPVAKGASQPLNRALLTAAHVHGDDGLGGISHLRTAAGQLRYAPASASLTSGDAVTCLLDCIRRAPGELTLIALGPLTNVAQALQRDASLVRQLAGVVIMGGAVTVPGNITPVAEFNIYVDPEAAQIVFASGLPTTLIGLDVTERVRLRAETLGQHVRPGSSALGQFVAECTAQTMQFSAREEWQVGMAMHDPLAVGAVVDPGRDAGGVHDRDARCRPSTAAARREACRPCARGPGGGGAAFFGHVFNSAPRMMTSTDPHILVIGSANVDFTVQVPRLPQVGETVSGGDFRVSYGGKGANQALAAHLAGAPVWLIARLGRDQNGESLYRHLTAAGLSPQGLWRDDEVPSGVALIMVDSEGRNLIATAAGSNRRLSVADIQGFESSAFNGPIFLTQLETPLEIVEYGLRRARDAGMTTILNPAPAQPLSADFLALAHLLTPNETEASLLSGVTVTDLDTAQQAGERLLAMGCRTVIITLGEQGALLVRSGEVQHFPAFAVTSVDTTAAGDAFNGVLAAALFEGRALEQAIVLANAAGALCVTKRGAQEALPTRQEIEALIESKR